MVGSTISHFRILEKLGEGGMGVVYKAQDTKLNRAVALKFLPDRVNRSEQEKSRFLQEAQAAASLNHPNICTIHGVEEVEGKMFIAMEFVDGGTLRERLPFAKTNDAINVAIQIGEALQEAHSKGIVHRDIKADNIMLTSKAQAKVMDFGLAKLKGAMKLTRTSGTVGTLGYMAPEQIQGGEADHRSDIFSFGVLLFEMLTGHLPFRGEHEAAMMYSIMNETPDSVLKHRSDLPAELERIIARALEKDAEDRYQHADDLVSELRRLLKQTSKVPRASDSSTSIPKTPVAGTPQASALEPVAEQWKSKKTILIVIASVMVAGAAVAIFLMLRGGGAPSDPMVTRLLKIPSSNANQPNISADGSWIVFVAEDAKGIQNLYMLHASGGEPKRITEDTIFTVKQMPCFSPDASQIVYERAEFSPTYQLGLYVVSTLGGTSRRLVSNATLPVWSPDGKHIAYFRRLPGQSYDLFIANADGTDETRITNIKPTYFYNVAWSPDSKALAFLRSFLSPAKERYTEIFVRAFDDSTTERQITNDKKIIDDFCWASTGEIIFNSTRGGDVDLWVMPEDGGAPTQLTLGAGADRVPRVSKEANRLVYVNESEPSNLWTLNLSTKDTRQLTFEDVQVILPVFSPDGSKIIYWRSDLFENKQNYFVICSKDGSEPTKFVPLVENYTLNGWPPARWSTDGKSILFNSFRRDTVRKNPDSVVFHSAFFEHELTANITRKIADGELFDLSRDGKYVLFRRDRDSISTRTVLALKTAPEKPIKEASSPWTPSQFSVDSKSVITQDSLGLSFLSVEDGKTKQRVKTSKYFAKIHPFPDGKSILGSLWDPARNNRSLVRLLLQNGSVDRIAEIAPTASIWSFGCSISPDGMTLLYSKKESKNRIVLLDNFR